MNEGNRQLWAKTALVTAAGIGVCLVATKYRSQIYQKLQSIANYKNPLRNQKVEIVSSVDECRALLRNIKSHCDEYSVLGFDCEWVTVGGARRPVALLQLASHRGLCALIRLSHLPSIPSELKEILEDDNIVKVGVCPMGDANYLARDYGICVASTLDLRYMAWMCHLRTGGLAKLSEMYLNIFLDKDWRIRCSDWEAPILSKTQIEYAAKDAHVGIELFKFFAHQMKPMPIFGNQTKHIESILNDKCFPYFDLNFQGIPNALKGQGTKQTDKQSNNSVPKFKEPKKVATRQKPLYSNCLLQAPDGELLSTCDDRKAMWYVNKGIGELISEDPLTVRLKFEPAGRAVGETGKYYQIAKENQCVVCGDKTEYIRKNVVPREYRKYFPTVMKDHTSHDIVLLCPRCHQLSNLFDLKMRESLAKECEAPFADKCGETKTVKNPDLKELKSISRALLLQRDRIPEERLTELRERLKQLCPDVKEITDELLKSYNDIETSQLNENYYAHGAKVVEYFQKSDQGLLGLERMWRKHFLEMMRPKYLPSLWSIEHNAERLEIRVDEGRLNSDDPELIKIFGEGNEHDQLNFTKKINGNIN